MTEADRPAFSAALAALSEACQRDMSEMQVSLYWASLRSYPIEVVRERIMFTISTWTSGGGNRALPMPGDIKAAIQRHLRLGVSPGDVPPERQLPGQRLEPWHYHCQDCRDRGCVFFEQDGYTLAKPCTCPAGDKLRPLAHLIDNGRGRRKMA